MKHLSSFESDRVVDKDSQISCTKSAVFENASNRSIPIKNANSFIADTESKHSTSTNEDKANQDLTNMPVLAPYGAIHAIEELTEEQIESPTFPKAILKKGQDNGGLVNYI
jgi:hypothetical protein